MLSNVMPLSIRVKKSQSFIGGGGEGRKAKGREGKGRKSKNDEQHYVLFKDLETHLGLSLTSNGT